MTHREGHPTTERVQARVDHCVLERCELEVRFCREEGNVYESRRGDGRASG